MAKDEHEEREFLAGLKARTGRDLAEWMAAIAAQGFHDKNEIIDWLRTQGLPFARASWLERIHRNGGKPIHDAARGARTNAVIGAQAEEARPAPLPSQPAAPRPVQPLQPTPVQAAQAQPPPPQPEPAQAAPLPQAPDAPAPVKAAAGKTSRKAPPLVEPPTDMAA